MLSVSLRKEIILMCKSVFNYLHYTWDVYSNSIAITVIVILTAKTIKQPLTTIYLNIQPFSQSLMPLPVLQPISSSSSNYSFSIIVKTSSSTIHCTTYHRRILRLTRLQFILIQPRQKISFTILLVPGQCMRPYI